MSNANDTPSIGVNFFGAVRDLNRRVNYALDTAKASLSKQGIFGVSASNMVILQIMLEFEPSSSAPLDLAELGMMDKGAFSRGLESLEQGGFITLEKKEKKITKVSLTEKGRKVAVIVQDELNKAASELQQSTQLAALARFTNDPK